MNKLLSFVDRKFDLLLAAALFVAVFYTWVRTGFQTEIKDILWILVGSVGTLLGVKGRDALMRKTDIRTGNIESASTEYGDVVVDQDSKISKTET